MKAKQAGKPIQLSIWEVLEHPIFEKNLTEEMDLLSYTGKNYNVLKQQLEQKYQADMALLEMAKDSALKELLRDYPKPEDLTIKYVETISKKSHFSKHKRDIIEQLFGNVIKRSAIAIINEKESCKSESPKTSSPDQEK